LAGTAAYGGTQYWPDRRFSKNGKIDNDLASQEIAAFRRFLKSVMIGRPWHEV
jgi:hypothetical protein